MQLRLPVNPRLTLALAVIIGLSILSLIQSGWFTLAGGKLTLAVVGPMSGANAPNGQEMVRSVQLYLDQINAAGGVHGKTVELLTFDDQGDAEIARQQAQALVQQPGVLAVIGHYSSATALAASEIYHTAAIPVITGSATADKLTTDNPWSFRTIFNNQDQAIFLANYMRRVMGYSRAQIIHDANVYGSTLATTFEESFAGAGGRVTQKWSFDTSDAKGQERLAGIVQEVTASKLKPDDILFLATHGAEAAKLVVELRRRGVTNLIFGGDALAGVRFARLINSYPEEQTAPGYFSNGIYATTPLLFDLADKPTQDFRATFIEAYQVESTWAGATYYATAQLVIAALQQATLTGDNPPADRAALREQLKAFNTPANAFDGVTGKIYFDAQGNNQQPPTIGVYEKGALIAASVQLQTVTNLAQVANLEEAVAQGDILLVNSTYMYRTDVVYTGLDLNEVGNLTQDGGSYTVDFYIWFRARTGVDAANIEFLNYAVERLKSGERIRLGEPIAEKNENGVSYRAYRLKTDFSSDFNFADYPFDQQSLSIQFRHLTATRDRLIYVVDRAGLGDTSAVGTLAKLEESGALASLNDWQLTGANFFQDVLHNRSTLGNPGVTVQEADIQYSRFTLVMELRRNVLNFITRNLLPVFFIILLSYFSFYLPEIDFEALIPILTGTVLSIVFFHLDVSNDLGVSYTVMLDYVFYIMYAMFVFQLLLSLIAWRTETARLQKAIMFVVKLSYPLVVLITVAAFLYRYTDFWQTNFAFLWSRQQTAAQQIAQGAPAPTTTDQVTLRLGSWRLQEEAAMNRLLTVFHSQQPTITVQWEGITPDNYSDILWRQLEKGVAPDLFYIPSFSGGQAHWQANQLAFPMAFPSSPRLMAFTIMLISSSN